jgi:Family of unknown function (DUF6228)
MDEVVLDGQNGRELTLRRVARRDGDAMWSYEAALTLPSAHATAEVVDHGNWLGPFFQDLAESWQGFDGTKEYGSLEGQLHLACTHDGRGTVACVVTLGQPWPPEWHIEGVLEFGAGAHLESVASDVQAFVAASA